MTGFRPGIVGTPSATLRTALAAMQRSDERLANGLRIRRGSDDPAGLIASERLLARQSELAARIRVSEREDLMLNARDGALGALSRMGQDLVSLTTSPGTSPGESAANARQIASIVRSIDAAAGIARFNGSTLLDGFDAGALGRTQIGTDPDTGEPITASVRDLERLLTENPEAAQQVARAAGEQIAFAQAEVGLRQRALAAERRAAETEFINTARATSAIRDTDYASETGVRAASAVMGLSAIRVELPSRAAMTRTAGALIGALIDTAA